MSRLEAASGAPRPGQRYRMASPCTSSSAIGTNPIQLTVPGAQGGGIERHVDPPEGQR
mgnify:CR=1 FL=1